MLSINNISPTFIINSRNRIHGSITNFQYKVPLEQGNDFDTVALVSATIPKTWYTIVQGQNEFVVSENGPSRFITFPEGNYSAKTFKTKCAELLNAAAPVGWVYAITEESIPKTNKFIFTVTGNAGVQPIFLFNNDRMHEIMGFDTDSVNPFVGDSLTSTNVYNIQHTRYVTLKSSIAYNSGSSDSDQTTLATISCENIPDGNSITYEHVDMMEAQRQITNNTSNTYNFSLYDDHERLIQMNGVDFKLKIICFKYNEYYTKKIGNGINNGSDVSNKERTAK